MRLSCKHKPTTELGLQNTLQFLYQRETPRRNFGNPYFMTWASEKTGEEKKKGNGICAAPS
jgi:hypothetical protein